MVTSALSSQPAMRNGAHDLDFLHGSWRVVYGHGYDPLANMGSRRTDGFGVLRARQLANGSTTIAEWRVVGPHDTTGFFGFALMSYDSTKKQWEIQESQRDGHGLERPLVGRFDGGAGEFEGERSVEGRSVRIRVRLSVVGLERAVFTHALSVDGGTTWRLDWVMILWRGADASDSTFEQRISRPDTLCCRVVEVTHYRAPTGKADMIIGLFEREVAMLERGRLAQNVALLRDLDRPNVYVWIRGFDYSPEGRELNAFYRGPIWQEHREFIERSDIHIDELRALRPSMYTFGFVLGDRPGARIREDSAGVVAVTVYKLKPMQQHAFEIRFKQHVAPLFVSLGARPLGAFEPDVATDWGVEQLGVSGERRSLVPGRPPPQRSIVRLFFAWFPDAIEYARFVEALERDSYWRNDLRRQLDAYLAERPTTWRLVPVGRSRPFKRAHYPFY